MRRVSGPGGDRRSTSCGAPRSDRPRTSISSACEAPGRRSWARSAGAPIRWTSGSWATWSDTSCPPSRRCPGSGRATDHRAVQPGRVHARSGRGGTGQRAHRAGRCRHPGAAAGPNPGLTGAEPLGRLVAARPRPHPAVLRHTPPNSAALAASGAVSRTRPNSAALSRTFRRTPPHSAELCRTLPHFPDEANTAALCRTLPHFPDEANTEVLIRPSAAHRIPWDARAGRGGWPRWPTRAWIPSRTPSIARTRCRGRPARGAARPLCRPLFG